MGDVGFLPQQRTIGSRHCRHDGRFRCAADSAALGRVDRQRSRADPRPERTHRRRRPRHDAVAADPDRRLSNLPHGAAWRPVRRPGQWTRQRRAERSAGSEIRAGKMRLPIPEILARPLPRIAGALRRRSRNPAPPLCLRPPSPPGRDRTAAARFSCLWARIWSFRQRDLRRTPQGMEHAHLPRHEACPGQPDHHAGHWRQSCRT